MSCGGTLRGNDECGAIAVSNVVTDSREVSKSSLFVAIKGERTDGHLYIDKAYDSGACCVLCEKDIDTDKPYIKTVSTAQAVKDIAEYYRLKFENTEFIGVIGSVGKTSTKEMIASVLSQEFTVHKTEGNLNNELGVPLTLLATPEDADAAVVEMGISDFGEMTRLSKMVRPTVCVFTNIGYCHLENLKDRDGVFKAKTEVFEYAAKDALVIANGDDDKLSQMENVTAFYGLGEKNTYRAVGIQNDGEGNVRCTLSLNGEYHDAVVPALGSFMVTNALAAAAVGKAFNMSSDSIVKGIAEYSAMDGRGKLTDTGVIKLIDDCYNASPLSVKAAIDTLCTIDARRVLILGDMKELGEDEAKYHTEIGEYIAQKDIAVLITVGELAEYIDESAGDNLEVYHYDTVDEVKEELDDILHTGDAVLVKASHSMGFKSIVKYLKEL